MALAALVVVFAYAVYGLTGFGSTVIALPVLAHLIPLKFAVPMLMLLDVSAFGLFGARFLRRIEYREISWLIPFVLAGMVAGLTLLIQVAEHKLLAVLGAFLLLYAGYGLTRRGAPPSLARAWCAPIGLAGGALSALFGTGGVLFAIYNAGRIRDKEALRATNAAMILIASAARIALFAGAGLLSQDGLFATVLFLLPGVLGGVWLGNRLHAAVAAAAVVKAVYAVLVIAGLLLLARSLPAL